MSYSKTETEPEEKKSENDNYAVSNAMISSLTSNTNNNSSQSHLSLKSHSNAKQKNRRKKSHKYSIPKLTDICLLMMYNNLTKYESFDFLPQDMAAQLLVLVIERQALNERTIQPFLNTKKHEIIQSVCQQCFDLKKLPIQERYGCRGI